MAATCFQCVTGERNVLAAAPAAGEGFGTCYECWVHACPRHGDRTRQYFRCADCIAAEAGNSALTEPVTNPGRVLAEAPRLAALSAPMRGRFDPGRMRAAVAWVHGRVREGAPLLPGIEDIEPDGETSAAVALGFSRDEVAPGAAEEALRLRASHVEREVRDLLLGAWAANDEPKQVEAGIGSGESAAIGLAIAYTARGGESSETSPLALSGGFLLAAPLIVLGNAYSVANRFFW